MSDSTQKDEILAYLEGELSPEKQSRFEELLQQDSTLRAETEALRQARDLAREWALADPPQISQTLPRDRPVAVRVAHPGHRTWQWRAAAIAAVFVVGFGLGRLTQGTTQPLPGSSMVAPNAPVQPAQPVVLQPAVPEPPAATATPDAIGKIEQRFADAPERRQFTDERGRLVIETSLRDSGAQAIWVISGDLGSPQQDSLGQEGTGS